jgi:hypothetical protein
MPADQRKQCPKSRIISTPEVRAALAAAVSAQRAYHDMLKEYEIQLSPEQAVEAAKHAIATGNDPHELFQAALRLQAVTGDGAQIAKGRATSICSEAFETFRSKLTPLVDAAASALKIVSAEALRDETALFETYGLPHESTGVSKRLDEVQARLSEFRAALAERWSFRPMRGALGHVVDFFQSE